VNRSNGFSLIELLVAFAIMSMTLLIATTGFSFFMKHWDGQLTHFDQAAKNARRLMLMKRAFTGVYPYILRDKQRKAVLYFEGSQDSVVGVTLTSFFLPQQPSVFRLSVEQQPDFTYNLVYEEAINPAMVLTSLHQNIEFNRKIIIFSQLNNVKLSYFGYESSASLTEGKAPIWWQSFNALQRSIMPRIVRINFLYHHQLQQFDFPISQVDPRILVLFNDNF